VLLRRLGFGLLFALAGLVLAAIASYFLIMALSSNVHDRSVEAAMTSAFFFGPIGAVVGFIAGAIYAGRRVVAQKGDQPGS
jgi:hypothetical protein